jgi:Family of unknown function (DUF695)
MFDWLFGKKPQPTDDNQDAWSVATAMDGEMPLIIRFRSQPPAGINKTNYQDMIAITWQYEADEESSGMPGEAEKERMDELEDLLMPALESAKVAFLTVIVTGNGVREWQWYSRSAEALIDTMNKCLGSLPAFPISISAQKDPDWATYQQFLDA